MKRFLCLMIAVALLCGLWGCGNDSFAGRPADDAEERVELVFPEPSSQEHSIHPVLQGDVQYWSLNPEEITAEQAAACIQPDGLVFDGADFNAGADYYSATRDLYGKVCQLFLLYGDCFLYIMDAAAVTQKPSAPKSFEVHGIPVETAVIYSIVCADGIDWSATYEEYTYEVRFERDGLIFYGCAYLREEQDPEKVAETTEPLRRFVAQMTRPETRVDLNAVGDPGEEYIAEQGKVPLLSFPSAEEVRASLTGEHQQVTGSEWLPPAEWGEPEKLTREQIASLFWEKELLFDGLNPAELGIEVTGSAYYDESGTAQYVSLGLLVLENESELEAVGISFYRDGTVPDLSEIEGPKDTCDFLGVPVTTRAVYYSEYPGPGSMPEFPLYYVSFTTPGAEPAGVTLGGYCDLTHDAALKDLMRHIVAECTRGGGGVYLSRLDREPVEKPAEVTMDAEGELHYLDQKQQLDYEAFRKLPELSGEGTVLLPRAIYEFNYFITRDGDTEGVIREVYGLALMRCGPEGIDLSEEPLFFGIGVLDIYGWQYDPITGHNTYGDTRIELLGNDDTLRSSLTQAFSASYQEEEAQSNADFVMRQLAEFREDLPNTVGELTSNQNPFS